MRCAARLLISLPLVVAMGGAVATAAPRAVSAPSLNKVFGLKWPNSRGEGRTPVPAEAMSLPTDLPLSSPFAQDDEAPRSYNALLPYVLASPDQEDAGSCLYMSLTGIAEMWLARQYPEVSRRANGPLDLSERYMMNMAGRDEDKNQQIPNWKTDSILLYNQEHRTVLNRDYPFTRGWYTTDASDQFVPASPTTPQAVYDSSYNWIDQRPQQEAAFVKLPHFKREVLFATPSSNQWDVGVAPKDIVERVKTALTEHDAPVHVIYNHFGYWHAVTIVGYNDDLPNGGCAFVTKTKAFLESEPADLRRQAVVATDPAEHDRLLASAQRHEEAAAKLTNAYRDQGGCHGSHGVFYVRDSIYPAASEPLYDYDPSRPGQTGHYSKKVVMHEYDWLRYLGNHVVQIGIEQ